MGISVPLPLKDVHPGIVPSWWPPAPGWWWLAAAIVLVVGVGYWWWRRRMQRQHAIAQLFDTSIAATDTLPQQVAAMSELLRRAARRIDPLADRLEGDDWLEFLDAGLPTKEFTRGAGGLILDGGYRKHLTPADVAALREVARRRFLHWMRRP